MGTVHYINLNAASGSGTGISEGNERNTLPTQAAGDVWSFQRGSTIDRVAQLGITQPLVITSHGSPTAPKPRFSSNVTASTSAFNCTQDVIWHEVELTGFQPASNSGTAINFAVRGGGAPNSGPGAGGIFLNVDFSDIKGNAVQVNPNDGSTPTASGDFMVLLGCTFNNIGDDAMFLKTRYLRVGWCDIRRTSQLTTTGDCIHNMDSFLEYAWIHDNYLDHTDVDSKQCIMLDDPTTGNALGLAVIERNVILGAGTNVDDNIPVVNHVPVNSQMRTIFRRNFVRTKRFGAVLGPSAGTPAGRNEAYSNVFDVMAQAAGTSALIHVTASDTVGNTFWRRNSSSTDFAVGIQSSTAKDNTIDRNLFVGFATAINSPAGVIRSQNRNAFFRCGAKGGAIGTNDVDLTEDPVPGAIRQDFRPTDAALFFKSFDRRFPDFFGRFASAGIGHIGACLGAF